MSIVLNTEQREQAGSSSYNRFEYQVHWIACYVIKQICKKNDHIIFCEYHDDMSEVMPDRKSFRFYQVKTKDESTHWNINELIKKSKRKDGSYKSSFLGFIFYNFWKFGPECSSCYFVSNCDFDTDMLAWQACIEDGYILHDCNIELYNKIKDRLEAEYGEAKPEDFDVIFDKFIQNTYLIKSELGLNTYEDQTKAQFFEMLKGKNIQLRAAYLIYDQLISDVKRKSKKEIRVPISMKKLKEDKGIEIKELINIIDEHDKKNNMQIGFSSFLDSIGILIQEKSRIMKCKENHDLYMTDANNIKYLEIVLCIKKAINKYKLLHTGEIDIIELKKYCLKQLVDSDLDSYVTDSTLIEVLYYEGEQSDANN